MLSMGREPNPRDRIGTPEHAAEETQGRWPGVQDALQWLTFAHLPEGLRRFSAPFYYAAIELIREITIDSDELVTSLHKLIEAKDAGVRAGSIPRP